MTNQALALSSASAVERALQSIPPWPHDASDAQIHDIECLEPKISQIVMNAVGQFLSGTRRIHDWSAPRRAPTLVTITSPSG